MTSIVYWVGDEWPRVVFVRALFMMRSNYGSRARSVPEYLSSAFDEENARLERDPFEI